MPQQKHAGRNCVKQSALGHKHGKRYAFPGDCFVALIVEKLQLIEKLKTRCAAIKQEAGDTEGAGPAEKRVKRCE